MSGSTLSKPEQLPRILILHVLVVLGCFLPRSAPAQWDPFPDLTLEETRIRLSIYGGWFRISHSRFENYYASRWGWAPGGLLRVRVRGLRFLAGIRSFRQKLNTDLRRTYPSAGSNAWQQTVWNFGLNFGRGGHGRMRTATYFGLCIHEARERAGPFILEKSRSSTLGFFILLEGEYLITRRFGLGWMVELSSAASGRAAAFEANSIGGLYLGMALHFHPF